MAKFALRARWVFPVESPPIPGGVVTIVDDRIVAVGTRAAEGAAVEDLGEVALLPGLVNAHTHLEFSQLRQPLGQPGLSLPEWIELVIGSRKQQSDVTSGVLGGLRESLRGGVTTVGEIATANPRLDSPGALPTWVAFHEVIGFSAARVESVFAELTNRLQRSETTPWLGISPHAPYTVHPELLTRLVALGAERQLPVAMHLAESREELQLLGENAGPFRTLLEQRSMWDGKIFAAGRKPLDYLQVLADAPRALVIHGNYLTLAEIQFLAQRRQSMSVVYCPRTHAYFEHGAYPLLAMLEQGVTVALGTDSRASNPDLSLLAEMRYVAQSHPGISPEQVLALGTTSGATALGLDQTAGSLGPGKWANLFSIAMESDSQSPLATILASDQLPQRVWLRGQLSFPSF